MSSLDLKSRRAWKACAPLVALAAVLFAAYFMALRPRVDPTGALLVSILSTVSAMAIMGGVVMIARSWPDARALGRAKAGSPPRDGRLEAFAGRLEPEGTPLASPFTGTPCSLYEYGVEPDDDPGSAYFGIGLTPSIVRCARGDVRLLGFPALDHFPRRRAGGADARERAERFLTSVASERLASTPAAMASLIGDLLAASDDDDGTVRRDWRRVELGPLREEDTLYEQLVSPKASVTALGTYSQAQSGLVAGGGIVRLVPGGLRAARKLLVADARRYATFGIVWGLLLQAFFIAIWVLAPGG